MNVVAGALAIAVGVSALVSGIRLLITRSKLLFLGDCQMKKYKREKLIVSIFAVIFVVIVVILGNFLVTYISSDLSFGQNCLLRIPFYGTLVFTSSLIGLLFRNDSKKDIVEENSKGRIQDE